MPNWPLPQNRFQIVPMFRYAEIFYNKLYWYLESYAKSCQLCSQHVRIYMNVVRNEASIKDANESHGNYLEVWTSTLIEQPCTLGVSVSVRSVMLSIILPFSLLWFSSHSCVLFVFRKFISERHRKEKLSIILPFSLSCFSPHSCVL